MDNRTFQIKTEAERYLAEDVTVHPERGGPNALQYWKVCIAFIEFYVACSNYDIQSMQHVFPQLSRMAMDYLAIQGSATPVERVWSAASDTDTKKRNRLGSERLAALQFLKNVYRQLRVKKMTAEEKREWREERLCQINMMDWREDVVHSRDIKFIDIELDFA